MMLEKLIESGLLRQFKGRCIDDATDVSLPLVLDEKSPQIEVKTEHRVQLVVCHETALPSAMTLTLAPYAKVSVIDIYNSEKYASMIVEQAESSECKVVQLLVGGAHTTYEILLNGRGAESVLYGAMVASGRMHASTKVTTRHLVADCKSDTVVKSVAKDRATAEFKGLVYVAQDAQRTDAKQLNRNIELGNGRVYSEPQLEIYADDVKCSHGSTVGQLDEQALFYMRQRGIPQEQAERLMLEGFVGDVVAKCDIEPLAELLCEALQKRLNE